MSTHPVMPDRETPPDVFQALLNYANLDAAERRRWEQRWEYARVVQQARRAYDDAWTRAERR